MANYNQKIQMQMMEDESAHQFLSLCNPLSTLILNQMNSNEQHIESEFMLTRTSKNKYCILMGSRKIAFGKLIDGESCYFGYIQISFDLKFAKILQNDRNIKSKIIGFSLFLGGLQISIFIQNQTHISYWLKKLSASLSQKGFHQAFKPIKKLGKGGFATVYEVNRLVDNKKFAVKAFSKGKNGSSDSTLNLNSLINQIQLLRVVRKEQNVLQLYEVYESENSIYAVFQLLQGGDLKSLMQQKAISFTSLQIKKCMYNLLKGVSSMHKHRIMHRDLKPDNILLRKRYRDCEYKFELTIGDFGLATYSDAQNYIYQKCGTPGYVAPQIIRMLPRQHIQPVCDIFSLGVIFHLLLCGKPLFGGKTFEQIYSNNKNMNFNLNDEFYKGIDSIAMDLLKKMLIQDPNQRISVQTALNSEYLREARQAQQYSKFLQTMQTPVSLGFLNSQNYQQELFQSCKQVKFFNFNQNLQ